jgi:DNA polymerase III delta prime subunit
MSKNTLWVEKYRPNTLDDYIGNSTLKKTFQTYLDTNDVPHLLLHGNAGGGKTTLAKIIANKIADGNYMYINASDENSVDTVRDKIKQFASSVGFGGLKIIILDEADFTTPNFQAALRNVMETFSKNTRFILTCNYVDKIIEPIQSRCQAFNIVPPSKTDVAIMMAEILKKEEITYNNKDLATVINKSFPDVRKVINTLQQNSVSGQLSTEELDSNQLSINDDIIKILASKDTKLNKFNKIRQLIADALVRDYNPVYRFMYDSADKILPKNPAAIILIVADAQYKDAFVIDHEINTMSMFIQIINELQGE